MCAEKVLGTFIVLLGLAKKSKWTTASGPRSRISSPNAAPKPPRYQCIHRVFSSHKKILKVSFSTRAGLKGRGVGGNSAEMPHCTC